MASNQRRRPKVGPAAAKSRARSRPKPVSTPRRPGNSNRANQESHEPATTTASELATTPRNILSDPAGKTAPDQIGTPEASPKTFIDFLWCASRDEKAQKGLCRLMWTAGGAFLGPLTVIAVVTMPATSTAKVGMTCASALFVVIGAVFRRIRKRRAAPSTEPPADGGTSADLAR